MSRPSTATGERGLRTADIPGEAELLTPGAEIFEDKHKPGRRSPPPHRPGYRPQTAAPISTRPPSDDVPRRKTSNLTHGHLKADRDTETDWFKHSSIEILGEDTYTYVVKARPKTAEVKHREVKPLPATRGQSARRPPQEPRQRAKSARKDTVSPTSPLQAAVNAVGGSTPSDEDDWLPSPSDSYSVRPQLLQLNLGLYEDTFEAVVGHISELKFNVAGMDEKYLGLQGDGVVEMCEQMLELGMDAELLHSLTPWLPEVELRGQRLLRMLELLRMLNITADKVALQQPYKTGKVKAFHLNIRLTGDKLLEALEMMLGLEVTADVLLEHLNPIYGDDLLEMLRLLRQVEVVEEEEEEEEGETDSEIANREAEEAAAEESKKAKAAPVPIRKKGAPTPMAFKAPVKPRTPTPPPPPKTPTPEPTPEPSEISTETFYMETMGCEHIKGRTLLHVLEVMEWGRVTSEVVEQMKLKGEMLERALDLMQSQGVVALAYQHTVKLAGRQLLLALETMEWGNYTAAHVEHMDRVGPALAQVLITLKTLGIKAAQYRGGIELCGVQLTECLNVMAKLHITSPVHMQLQLTEHLLLRAVKQMLELEIDAQFYLESIGLLSGDNLSEALELMHWGKFDRGLLEKMQVRGIQLLRALRQMRVLQINGACWTESITASGSMLIQCLDIMVDLEIEGPVVKAMRRGGDTLFRALLNMKELSIKGGSYMDSIALSGNNLTQALDIMQWGAINKEVEAAFALKGPKLLSSLQIMKKLGITGVAYEKLVALEGDELTGALDVLDWGGIGEQELSVMNIPGPPLRDALFLMKEMGINAAVYNEFIKVAGGYFSRVLQLFKWGGFDAHVIRRLEVVGGHMTQVMDNFKRVGVTAEIYRRVIRLSGEELVKAMNEIRDLGITPTILGNMYLTDQKLGATLDGMTKLGITADVLEHHMQVSGPALHDSVVALSRLDFDAKSVAAMGLKESELAVSLQHMLKLGITANHYKDYMQLSGPPLARAVGIMEKLEINSAECFLPGPDLEKCLTIMFELRIRGPTRPFDVEEGTGLYGLVKKDLLRALEIMQPLKLDAKVVQKMHLFGDRMMEALENLKILEIDNEGVAKLCELPGTDIQHYLRAGAHTVVKLGLAAEQARHILDFMRDRERFDCADNKLLPCILTMELQGPVLYETMLSLERLSADLSTVQRISLSGEKLSLAVHWMSRLGVGPEELKLMGPMGPMLYDLLWKLNQAGIGWDSVRGMNLAGVKLVEAATIMSDLGVSSRLSDESVLLIGGPLLQTLQIMKWGGIDDEILSAMDCHGPFLHQTVMLMKELHLQGPPYMEWVHPLSGQRLLEALQMCRLAGVDKKTIKRMGLRGDEFYDALMVMKDLSITGDTYRKCVQLGGEYLKRSLEIMKWGSFSDRYLQDLDVKGPALYECLVAMEELEIDSEMHRGSIRLTGDDLVKAVKIMQWGGYTAEIIGGMGLPREPLGVALDSLRWAGVDMKVFQETFMSGPTYLLTGPALGAVLATMKQLGIRDEVTAGMRLAGDAFTSALESMRVLGLDATMLTEQVCLAGEKLSEVLGTMVAQGYDGRTLLMIGLSGDKLHEAMGHIAKLGISAGHYEERVWRSGPELLETLRLMSKLGVTTAEPFLPGPPLTRCLVILDILQISAPDPLRMDRPGGLLDLRGAVLQSALELMLPLRVGAGALEAMELDGGRLLDALTLMRDVDMKKPELLELGLSGEDLLLHLYAVVHAVNTSELTAANAKEAVTFLEAIGCPMDELIGQLDSMMVSGSVMIECLDNVRKVEADVEMVRVMALDGERLQITLRNMVKLGIMGHELRELGVVSQDLFEMLGEIISLGLNGRELLGIGLSGRRLIEGIGMVAQLRVTSAMLAEWRETNIVGARLFDVLELAIFCVQTIGTTPNQAFEFLKTLTMSSVTSEDARLLLRACAGGGLPFQVVRSSVNRLSATGLQSHSLVSTILHPPLTKERRKRDKVPELMVAATDVLARWSSQCLKGHPGKCCFDGVAHSWWEAGPGAMEASPAPLVGAILKEKVLLSDYAVQSAPAKARGSEAKDPAQWLLEGSDDGGLSWFYLDGRSGVQFGSRAQELSFEVPEPKKINAIRMSVLACRDPKARWPAIGAIVPKYWVPARPVLRQAVISHAWGSHEAPDKSNPPWEAFDGLDRSYWESFQSKRTNRVPWLAARFQEGCLPIDRYTLLSNIKDPSRDPRVWRLEGSQDGGLTWPFNLHEVDGKQTQLEFNTAKTFHIAAASPVNAVRVVVVKTRDPEAPSTALGEVTFSYLKDVEEHRPEVVELQGGRCWCSGKSKNESEVVGNLFNSMPDTQWSLWETEGGWVAYHSPAGPVRLYEYTLQAAAGEPECDPREWIVEGSTDGGETWTVELDHQTAQFFPRRFLKRNYRPGIGDCEGDEPREIPLCNAFRVVFLDVCNQDMAQGLQLGGLAFRYVKDPEPDPKMVDAEGLPLPVDTALSERDTAHAPHSVHFGELDKEVGPSHVLVPPRWSTRLRRLSNPGKFTVSMWFKFQVTLRTWATLIAKPAAGNAQGWTLALANVPELGGDVLLLTGTSAKEVLLATTHTVVHRNKWTHVVATYDGVWAKLYIDGKMATEVKSAVGIFLGSHQPLLMGMEFPGGKMATDFGRPARDVHITDVACWEHDLSFHQSVQVMKHGAMGVKADKLLGYWRFGEAEGSALVRDVSGNHHHGVLMNGASLTRDLPSHIEAMIPPPPAEYAKAVRPGCMVFGELMEVGEMERRRAANESPAPQLPGPPPHVVIPQSKSIEQLSRCGTFTASAWIWTPGTDATERAVISKPASNDKTGWRVSLVRRELRNCVQFTGVGVKGMGPFLEKEVPLEEWFHVCATYDGTTCAMYVDGRFACSAPCDYGGFRGSHLPLMLGMEFPDRARPDRGRPVFEGTRIADVVCWTCGISQGDVQVLFNLGPDTVRRDECVGHWRFEVAEPKDPEWPVQDCSGRHNHGQVIGQGTASKLSPPAVSQAALLTWPFGPRCSVSMLGKAYGYCNFERLDLHTNFTVSCWVRTTSMEEIVLVSWGEDAPLRRRSMVLWGGALARAEMNLYFSGFRRNEFEMLGSVRASDERINDGKWHHLCVSYNAAGLVRTYVDGYVRQEEYVRLEPFEYSGTYVGTSMSKKGFMVGSIDEIGIWDVVVNDEDVAAIWNDGSPGKAVDVRRDRQVAIWRVDERSVAWNTLVDRSGHSHYLSLRGKGDGSYTPAPGIKEGGGAHSRYSLKFAAHNQSFAFVNEPILALDVGWSMSMWLKVPCGLWDEEMVIISWGAENSSREGMRRVVSLRMSAPPVPPRAMGKSQSFKRSTSQSKIAHPSLSRKGSSFAPPGLIRQRGGASCVMVFSGHGEGNNVVAPAHRLMDGKWHHVAVVATESRAVSLYIDGAEQATGLCDGLRKPSYNGTYFGKNDPRHQPNYMWGFMDEFVMWGAAISAEQVMYMKEMSRALTLGAMPVADRLVGWWRLDHSQDDFSGHGSQLQLHNTTWAPTDPPDPLHLEERRSLHIKKGERAHCSNDQLDILNNFTVACWIKTFTTAAMSGVVCWGENRGGMRRSLVLWNGGDKTDPNRYLFFSGHNDNSPKGEFGGSDVRAGDVPINDGKWHHVCVSVDKNDLVRTFVDGVPRSVARARLRRYNEFGGVDVGCTPSPWPSADKFATKDPFDGLLDDVTIWPGVLTDEDVANLYSGGPELVGVHPAALWRFDVRMILAHRVRDESGGRNALEMFGGDEGEPAPSVQMNRVEELEQSRARELHPPLPGTSLRFPEYSEVYGYGYGFIKASPSLGLLSDPGNLTASIWVRPGDVDAVERALVSKPRRETGSSTGWRISLQRLADKGDCVQFAGVGTASWLTTLYAPIVRNEWSHVLATYDGHMQCLYVNGRLRSEDQVAVVGFEGERCPLLVGLEFPESRGGEDKGRGSPGTCVSDLAVWSQPLAPGEVAQVYSDGPMAVWAQKKNMVGYWRLNEVSGGVMTDSSHHSNHGELISGARFSSEFGRPRA